MIDEKGLLLKERAALIVIVAVNEDRLRNARLRIAEIDGLLNQQGGTFR